MELPPFESFRAHLTGQQFAIGCSRFVARDLDACRSCAQMENQNDIYLTKHWMMNTKRNSENETTQNAKWNEKKTEKRNEQTTVENLSVLGVLSRWFFHFFISLHFLNFCLAIWRCCLATMIIHTNSRYRFPGVSVFFLYPWFVLCVQAVLSD